ncbi:MAG TPA: transposase [Tepidisphaeraceae bacterium]|nr:transposase [Tepidisphaeraceae bacterium]
MPNRLFKRSKLGVRVFRQLLRLFALDLTASDAARLTGVSVRSVNDIYLRPRTRLAHECERRRPIRSGEVEVDESYFGARRVRGKRGRGAGGKAIVFGVFKRDGKVYTEIVPDARRRRAAKR